LNETTLLRQINGLWFECSMKYFPHRSVKGDSPWRFDLAEKKDICRADARDLYDRCAYCVAKRQLSRRELREFGISNLNSAVGQSERSVRHTAPVGRTLRFGAFCFFNFAFVSSRLGSWPGWFCE
jgi:hypothetical protein